MSPRHWDFMIKLRIYEKMQLECSHMHALLAHVLMCVCPISSGYLLIVHFISAQVTLLRQNRYWEFERQERRREARTSGRDRAGEEEEEGWGNKAEIRNRKDSCSFPSHFIQLLVNSVERSKCSRDFRSASASAKVDVRSTWGLIQLLCSIDRGSCH